MTADVITFGLQVRGFRPGDLLLIQPQEAQQAPLAKAPGWRDWGDRIHDAGPCWSVFYERTIVFIAGGVPIKEQPGDFYLWSLVDKRMPRRAWPQLAREIKERIPQFAALGATRVLADAAIGFTPAHNFLRALDFEEAGPSPQANHLRYRRTLS